MEAIHAVQQLFSCWQSNIHANNAINPSPNYLIQYHVFTWHTAQKTVLISLQHTDTQLNPSSSFAPFSVFRFPLRFAQNIRIHRYNSAFDIQVKTWMTSVRCNFKNRMHYVRKRVFHQPNKFLYVWWIKLAHYHNIMWGQLRYHDLYIWRHHAIVVIQ